MGSGNWDSQSFSSYSRSRGRSVNSRGIVDTSNYSHAQEMYKSRHLVPALDPKNIMRECCDSDEHPKTKPVILGLDVTGSMGDAAMEVAGKLNEVMTKLYDEIQDVEFCVMGIGDLYCDTAPIQMSQFESDIRIAEQLDQIYFEGNGGGNGYETYTTAWYMGLRHTKLDCWKRGEKGIIITLGDEPLNPYLNRNGIKRVVGDDLEGDVDTSVLYQEVTDKFDVYHIFVRHGSNYYEDRAKASFSKYLDKDHLRFSSVDAIVETIISIITNANTCMYIGESDHPVSDEGPINSEIRW